MITLLITLMGSLLCCLALVPLLRRLALRCGLVDRPDGHRKIHGQATPVSGGLAILLSCCVALSALFLAADSQVAENLREHGQTVLSLLLGAVVICGIGVLDDLGKLRGRYKLLGQVLAAAVIVFVGQRWVQGLTLFGVRLELDWFGIPFTIFFLVGTINSLNLIDGMDGLLGSVGSVLSLSLAAMACLNGNWWAAMIALALAGALIGFLRYNLVRASIFLGDAGSMLIGLILGALSIQCSLKAPSTLAIALPLALLILPIFDTTAAIVRRKLTGRSIYTTDRGHLHHCLQRAGLSTQRTVLVIFLFCVLACVGALASKAFESEWIALLTAASIVATLVLTRWFGHAEAMLIKGRLQSLLARTDMPHQMEVRLQGSARWNNLWCSLKSAAAELHLKGMLLDVNAPFMHEGYHARWGQTGDAGDGPALWHAEIPIAKDGRSLGRLVLCGLPDSQPVWLKIASVMKVVETLDQSVLPNEEMREATSFEEDFITQPVNAACAVVRS